MTEVKRRTGTLRRRVGLLLAVTVLGLASSACARVQPHFALPDLAMGDPSFGPTIEAYTATRVARGNSVDLLLNGDQIFPAQLEAIRSARRTISYAQYFYEESPIGQEIAAALAERCRAGVRGHVLLDGFGTLLMPAEYRETMTNAGCEVTTFRPLGPLVVLSPFGFGKDNNRSHRRILVVDGRVGFTGGVGVSPKWVLQRYRLHEAAERIAEGRDGDWAATALELGYFDQAHFIRDFKALIGASPAQYAGAAA